MLASRDPSDRAMPLATLGDSLVLTLPATAPDLLGDAVVRLYERYAETVPAGPDRARAAATARSIAALLGPRDSDRTAQVFAPNVGIFDHRASSGPGSARGQDAVRQAQRTIFEPVDGARPSIDDVLALRPAALLILTSHSGGRGSGVGHERRHLQLWAFSAEGLLEQCEWFDPDRSAEALARFDDFAALANPPVPVRRPGIANAATVFGARADAAVAARDGDEIEALIAEAAEIVDHRIGRSFGRTERLAGLRALLSGARDPASRHEPIAALGRSLALLHRTLSASGFSNPALDAAAYHIEELCVVQADPEGRCERGELFAVDQLGDAVARLYQRHAELIPEGSGRARAAAIARSVATVLGPPDPDRVRPALALDVRYADHRVLGWGPARGVVAFVRALRTLRDALPEVEAQTIEVLALRADALLVRRTVAGELSAAGDRYRRRPLVLWAFGADGRVAHWEQFDGDQREQALARFDELAVPPVRPTLLESTATRSVDRFDRAWATSDWPALAALHAPGFHFSDRRPAMQLEQDRGTHLDFTRPLFDRKASQVSREVLATRGDRLVLIALRFAASEGKAVAGESLLVIEVNARGERVALVRFGPADRSAAHAELDARYAAGEATDHPAMWAALWDVRRAFAARDWDRLTSLVSADLVAEDHRLLGWGTVHSAEQYAAALRPVTELRPDVALRLDHLVLDERAALFVASWIGGEGAAAFEIPVVIVFRANSEGRIDRVYHYNIEQIGAARARLAELSAAPQVVPNAATAAVDRIEAAYEAGDWHALRALCAPDVEIDDRRRHVLVASDLDQWIADWRDARAQRLRLARRLVAAEGDHVALERVTWSGDGAEVQHLWLIETDEPGRIAAIFAFDLDDEAAAREEAQRRQ
jgi:SnoaL-like domain